LTQYRLSDTLFAMRVDTKENICKYFYDCGKISFAVLVIGVLAQKPVQRGNLIWGALMTLTLFGIGIIIYEKKGVNSS